MSTQTTILDVFKAIPPNKAKLLVTKPLASAQKIRARLMSMGVKAPQDLKPIDWRKILKDRGSDISVIRNQEECGSCWAVSTSGVLADLFIIQKNIKNLLLDVTMLAQCSDDNRGCGGGFPTAAADFCSHVGIPADGGPCPALADICKAGKNGCNLPICQSLSQECKNGIRYKVMKNSVQYLPADNLDPALSVANIKSALLKGPVVACFFVPYDFMAGAVYPWKKTGGIYVNGAYNDDLEQLTDDKTRKGLGITNKSQWGDIMFSGNSPFGHAVEIVGWDVGNAGDLGQVEYWIVKNSWGTDWMEDGYCRFATSYQNNGKRYNQYTAIDVPTSGIHTLSTGNTIGSEQFGGCIAFDPDVSSGEKEGFEYPPRKPSRSIALRMTKYLLNPQNTFLSQLRQKNIRMQRYSTYFNFLFVLGCVALVFLIYGIFRKGR